MLIDILKQIDVGIYVLNAISQFCLSKFILPCHMHINCRDFPMDITGADLVQ